MGITDQLISLTSDLSNLSSKVNERYSKRTSLLFPNEHTFVHYVERIEANSQSIHCLLQKLQSNLNIENSIGLLLRSNLVDYFNAAFISIGRTQSEKEWIDRVCIVNYDQLKKLRGYIKIGWLDIPNNEKGNVILNEHIETLTNMVDINLDKIKLPTPQQIVEEMLTNNIFKQFAKSVYDIFKYYSQYEHFGMLTPFMQKQDLKLDLERIKYGLYFTFKTLELCCQNLKIDQEIEGLDDLEKKFKK